MPRYGRLLTDAQWEKIRPLLPKRPKRPQGGRPPANDRKVLEGILWILRSGARWQDLQWSESFLDGIFAPAKKGATEWAKPAGGKARSGWWWSTARVFLWETTFTLPPRRKSGSRRRPFAPSA